MAGPFRSLFTREREFPSRVKTELGKRDRERFVSITEPYGRSRKAALKELKDEVGESRIQEASPKKYSGELILHGDTILVLSFLEHFLNDAYKSSKTLRNAIRKSDF